MIDGPVTKKTEFGRTTHIYRHPWLAPGIENLELWINSIIILCKIFQAGPIIFLRVVVEGVIVIIKRMEVKVDVIVMNQDLEKKALTT